MGIYTFFIVEIVQKVLQRRLWPRSRYSRTLENMWFKDQM